MALYLHKRTHPWLYDVQIHGWVTLKVWGAVTPIPYKTLDTELALYLCCDVGEQGGIEVR